MSEEKLSWDEEAKRKFDKALERVVSGEQTEENEASDRYRINLDGLEDMKEIEVKTEPEIQVGELSDEMKEKISERIRKTRIKVEPSVSKEFKKYECDLSEAEFKKLDGEGVKVDTTKKLPEVYKSIGDVER